MPETSAPTVTLPRDPGSETYELRPTGWVRVSYTGPAGSLILDEVPVGRFQRHLVAQLDAALAAQG